MYGPHNRIPLTQFVQPFHAANVSVRQYPDLAHSVDAQFALQEWDAPYAISYGRQVVNPLPLFHNDIIIARSNGSSNTIGVGAYSEGLNDDLNKFVWSAMGEDASIQLEDVVLQYASYFFGSDASENFFHGILGLEKNWKNKTSSSKVSIEKTLEYLEKGMEDMVEKERKTSWRATMYVRRGVMDKYVYELVQQDVALYNAAFHVLSKGGGGSSGQQQQCMRNIASASMILEVVQQNITNATLAALRLRIENYAELLDNQVGADVLQTQDTMLNMNTIDKMLYLQSKYLLFFLQNLTKMQNPKDACRELLNFVMWENPGEGGYYDNVGSILSSDHPHLVAAPGSHDVDPSCYNDVMQGGSNALGSDQAEVRPSWLRYSMAMYDHPLLLRYTDIDYNEIYVWEVVMWNCWFDCTGDVVRWMVNDVPLTSWFVAPLPMKKLSFQIPLELLSKNGVLEISCQRVAGLGGNGKTCQVSEAWLKKITKQRKQTHEEKQRSTLEMGQIK